MKSGTPEREAGNFIDSSFPPTTDSLFDLNNTELSAAVISQWKSLIWIRAPELYYPQKFSLFSTINPLDIKDGSAYFQSALVAISLYPERVQAMFESVAGTKPGQYVMRGYFGGRRIHVELDDYIPTDTKKGTPAFIKTDSKALWPLFAEKAWAKINGTFESIAFGSIGEALRFLTNSPYTATFTHNEVNLEDLWNHLTTALEGNHILCASTEKTPDEFFTSAPAYSYPILNAREVMVNGKLVRLLQILDPWENRKWGGDWSVGSTSWTEEAKKAIGYKSVVGTHKFFISLEDYVSFYHTTVICYVFDGYPFKDMECLQKPGDYCLIKFQAKEPTNGFLTIAQVPKRSMVTKYLNYEISETSIILSKIDGQNIKFIKGGMGRKENFTIKLDEGLVPGEYILFIEMNWCYEGIDTFVLNAYTSTPITLFKTNPRGYPEFLETVLKSCALQKTVLTSYEEKHEPMIKRYASINDSKAGYGYLYYRNESAESVLYEALTFKELKGIKMGLKGKKTQFELGPNQDYIIIFKKVTKGAGYSLDKLTKIRHSKPKLLELLKAHGKCKKLPDGEVYIQTLTHDFGNVWSCQNRSRTTVFAGRFVFHLQNLQFEEEESEFMLELQPGEEEARFLWNKEVDQSSGYKYEYVPFFKDIKPGAVEKVKEMIKTTPPHQIKYGEGLVPIQYYTTYKNGWYYWYFVNNSDKLFKARLEFTLNNLDIVEPVEEGVKAWELRLEPRTEILKCLRAVDYKKPVSYQVMIKLMLA